MKKLLWGIPLVLLIFVSENFFGIDISFSKLPIPIKSFFSFIFYLIKFVLLGNILCAPVYGFLILLKYMKTPTGASTKQRSSVFSKNNKVFSILEPSNNFWSGKKGLSLTYWGYFISGNVFLNIAALIFNTSELLVLLILLIFVVWNTLTIMGIFNAAEVYKTEKIKKGETYGFATAAKISSVLLMLSALGNAL